MKILHSHTTVIFIFIFFFSLFVPFLSLAIDTITPTKPLTINQTLVSLGEVFELGFFDPGNNNLYIGIWYKQNLNKTYVWVANRDTPITSSSGKLTISDNSNIVLVDQAEIAVWSSNQSSAVVNTVAQLLDSGNFVLRRQNDENPDNYIWQSFDHPTDTLLPGMKLGWDRKTGINRFLQSWKTNTDPASGDFSLKMNMDGFPEIFLLNKERKAGRTGPWNGRMFSGVQQIKKVSIMQFEFKENSDEIYYSFKMLNSSFKSRLIINSFGTLQRFAWVETTQTWSLYWFAPTDVCDNYGKCGRYGVCDLNVSPACKCIKGFQPRNQQAWNLQDGSDGCFRSSRLDCGSDGFLSLKNMKLPESSKAFVNETMNLSECAEICKRNCSCAAYANKDITKGGSGCVIWAVDLLDMRQFADSEGAGQDLHIRVAARDADQSSMTRSSKDGSGNGNQVIKIIATTFGVCAVVITLLILFYLKRKKMRRLKKFQAYRKGPQERTEDVLLNDGIIVPCKRDYYNETVMDEVELPLFDFTTLVLATNNFSEANKLGQGGFGCVYKGILAEGEVVAVKRLSRISDQGIEELKNEVRLIAKLQHRNLVRLLGCCIEVEEKLLIYEFMENKSLNKFLFEKKTRLNWQMRLDIICGIARGLLYLHQDSRFKIIHRDLKASNVLLDKEMNPKISDFGMARIFGRDQIEAETKKVVGTYGYMSPEYAMDGHFSTKSDVFSFGVLMLEIVSGKKNRGSYYTSDQLGLLAYMWVLWKEGKALELLDEYDGAKFSEDEVLRCIQIGLLCVQEHPEDRPSMSKVLLMLSSETAQLSQPKYPAFFIAKRNIEMNSSNKQDDCMTINQVTLSILDGR